MIESEFQIQINRLANVYGAVYKTERAQLIWKEMGNLPAASFAKIVDKLIGECRQAPMVQEFREAASGERERIWQASKKAGPVDWTQKTYSCRFCQDSGAVLALSKETEFENCGPFAFACDCPNGRKYKNYPAWQSRSGDWEKCA